jgi:hypothetical protein
MRRSVFMRPPTGVRSERNSGPLRASGGVESRRGNFQPPLALEPGALQDDARARYPVRVAAMLTEKRPGIGLIRPSLHGGDTRPLVR